MGKALRLTLEAQKNAKAVKFLPGIKKGLAETQAVNGCRVNKYAYKSLSQQVKTPLGQQRSVLYGHVSHGL